MEIFGVGPAELVLILVVVLLIFGPDQLPEIAKKLGKATRDFRHSMNEFNNEVNVNLKPFQDLKELKDGNLGSKIMDNLLVADDPAEEQKSPAPDETVQSLPPPAVEPPAQDSPPVPPAADSSQEPPASE